MGYWNSVGTSTVRGWLRIECDDGTPALSDSPCFVLIDELLPSTPHVKLLDTGTLAIWAPQFLLRVVWESFLDRDPSAEASTPSKLVVRDAGRSDRIWRSAGRAET